MSLNNACLHLHFVWVGISVVEVNMFVTCKYGCMVIVITFIWTGLLIASVKCSEEIIWNCVKMFIITNEVLLYLI